MFGYIIANTQENFKILEKNNSLHVVKMKDASIVEIKFETKEEADRICLALKNQSTYPYVNSSTGIWRAK